MTFQTVLAYLEAMDPLMDHLSVPQSPRSRTLAAAVHAKLSRFHSTTAQLVRGNTSDSDSSSVNTSGGTRTDVSMATKTIHLSSDGNEARNPNDSQDSNETCAPSQAGTDNAGHNQIRDCNGEARQKLEASPTPQDTGSSQPNQRLQQEDAVIARGEAIMAAGEIVLPVHGDEVASMIFHGGDGSATRAAAEDNALIRLMRGYDTVSIQAWLARLEPCTQRPLPLADICAASANDDQMPELYARLRRRHTNIAAHEAAFTGHSFTYLVILQVETLKFAMDWEEHASHTGSKKWISKFYASVFQTDPMYAPMFVDLTPVERATQMDALQSAFRAWKKSGERTVTARNRLLRLYTMYGAAVLFDPIWHSRGLVTRRSRLFPRLLDYLEANMPAPSPTLHNDNAVVLLQVIRLLGGPVEHKHVADFLDTRPPSCISNIV